MPPISETGPYDHGESDVAARQGRRAIALHAGVIVGLGALSVAMWARVWVTGSPSSSVTCPCGDGALNIWFLKWVEWSIVHLHNPLFTTAIYAGQGGANTLNPGSLAPGVFVSPITALFGPLVAFNVLSTVVPVANGWSMFVLLRKVTRFFPGQLLASVFWAFSPDVVNNAAFGHFNVDIAFFPPLLLWCLYDLLVDRRHRPARVGVLLAALVVVQFFTGPELLAMCAMLGVFAALVLLVAARPLIWERRHELATSGAWALGLSTLLLAYPVWFLLDGPRHTTGYPWPNLPADGIGLDSLVNAAVPSSRSVIAFLGYYGSPPPPVGYLGPVLLALIAFSIALWWRRRLGRCVLSAGVLAAVLSLGTHGGWSKGTWLPWRLFDHLPVLSRIIPLRLVIFTDLAAAVLLAMSLQGWWDHRVEVSARLRHLVGARPSGRGLPNLIGVLPCLVGVAALVPIAAAEGLPLTVHAVQPPAWFQDVAPHLRQGTLVLVIPDASSGVTDAMAWQAGADFSFRMIGGYALVPGADGHTSIEVDPIGGPNLVVDQLSFAVANPPTGTSAEIDSVRAALAQWGVQVVVVTPAIANPRWDVGFFTAVLGRAPLLQDGSWVWYGLGHDEPFPLGPLQLFYCSSARVATAATAECVLQARR